MVGIAGADDGGVYRISDDVALVQTVDYFTPIVDEADDWGRIAAANALSDVYAMGGTPLTALQVVGWPRDTLPMDLLGDVLVGAAEVLADAGCTIVGGHSIDDPEPKFGLAVTGVVHPDEIITNAAAKPGDVLVLTKPLGSGIAATAIKRGRASPELRDEIVAIMTALNRGAASAMRRIGVEAATDVTGFGLLGHLGEMIRASETSASITWADVPVVGGVAELAADGVIPGGTERNLEAVSRFTEFGALDETERRVIADAQTSGGILAAVDRPLLAAFLQALDEEEVTGVVVGTIEERDFADGPTGTIRIV
jgi:selenide,water dikinase